MWRLQFICLAQLAAASLVRPHRETLLENDIVDSGSIKILAGETRRLDSMILDVQSHLEHALKTLQSVKNASSNVTKNVTKAAPAKAAEVVKAEVAKPKNLTLAKAAPAPTLVIVKMSKADVNATLHNEQTLLRDLMKHLNNQIGNYNKEDVESKEMAAKMKTKFSEKLKKDEAELAQKGLRDFDHARLVNATRMDKTDLAYWTNDGELRHNMVHANLKMSTNLLSSVKNVLDVYNQAVKKGGVDDGLLKKVQAAALSGSFLQMRKDMQQRMHKYQASMPQRKRKYKAALLQFH